MVVKCIWEYCTTVVFRNTGGGCPILSAYLGRFGWGSGGYLTNTWFKSHTLFASYLLNPTSYIIITWYSALNMQWDPGWGSAELSNVYIDRGEQSQQHSAAPTRGPHAVISYAVNMGHSTLMFHTKQHNTKKRSGTRLVKNVSIVWYVKSIYSIV